MSEAECDHSSGYIDSEKEEGGRERLYRYCRNCPHKETLPEGMGYLA